MALGATPAGVITVGQSKPDGGGMLYRLLPPQVWRKAERKFDRLHEQMDTLVEPLRAACAATLAALDETHSAVAEAEALLKDATLRAQRTAYEGECRFFLTGAESAVAGVTSAPSWAPSWAARVPAGGGPALLSLLLHAPTLSDLLALLAPSPLPAELVEEARNALCTYLRAVVWPAAPSAAQEDVRTLLRLVEAQPALLDGDVVAAVLKNRSFAPPVDALTLRLLTHCRHAEGEVPISSELSISSVVPISSEMTSAGQAGSGGAATGGGGTAAGGAGAGGYPRHGPAVVGLVSWLGRLTPRSWSELPLFLSGEARPSDPF